MIHRINGPGFYRKIPCLQEHYAMDDQTSRGHVCNKSFVCEADPDHEIIRNAFHPRSLGLSTLDTNLESDMQKSRPAMDFLYSRHHLVKNYAVRRVSFETDRFPVMAGVVQQFQWLIGMHYPYKASLWLEGMLYSPMWQVYGVARPTAIYVARSWIWASLNFP